MRAVEKGNLSLVIRSLARHEEHVQACLVCREFLCDRLRSLDHPKMEDLALYNEVVLISYALVDLVDGILRIARNNAVHECAVYSACCLEPCLESFSEFPEVDILIDALLEFLSVEEDEFARENDKTLCLVA